MAENIKDAANDQDLVYVFIIRHLLLNFLISTLNKVHLNLSVFSALIEVFIKKCTSISKKVS